MLKDEQIDYIIAHGRKKLTWGEYLDYMTLLFPVMFIALGCIVYAAPDVGNKATLRESYAHHIVPVVAILAGILLLWFILKRLRQNVTYTSVATSLTVEENLMIINAAFLAVGFEGTQYQRYVTATTKMSLTSWGERVTAIPIGNAILINSCPILQPGTFYKDISNIKKLRSAILERCNP